MELLLIRHAQSENNAKPEPERIEDPGITPLGVRQAERLAEAFADWEVEHLVSSAFRRALLTAEPLRRRTGRRLQVWRGLHEVGGCYAGHELNGRIGRPGLNAEQVLAEFPETDFHEAIPETGWWSSRPYESEQQARARAAEQAALLLERFRDAKRVACVIHADFKALMLEQLLGMDWKQYEQHSLVNTGVTWLDVGYSPGLRVTVRHFNHTPHLDDRQLSD